MPTAVDPAALTVDGVTFGFDQRAVLRDVSLRVGAGERVAIVGANGAGKTTLLKVMANLLRPRTGAVLIGAQRVGAVARADLAKRIGMVPQDLLVPLDMTVRDLVECGRTAYALWFRGLGAADRRAIDAALAATDLMACADRRLGELSGGERQRAIVAMALAQEAGILLLDEPTQHLDLTRQGEVLDLLVRLSRDRALSIVATMHDLNLAAQYFDRLIVLADSRVIADGAPPTVVRSDILEAAYRGKLDFIATPMRAVPIVLPARTKEPS